MARELAVDWGGSRAAFAEDARSPPRPPDAVDVTPLDAARAADAILACARADWERRLLADAVTVDAAAKPAMPDALCNPLPVDGWAALRARKCGLRAGNQKDSSDVRRACYWERPSLGVSLALSRRRGLMSDVPTNRGKGRRFARD